jgi:hypothetical protein
LTGRSYRARLKPAVLDVGQFRQKLQRDSESRPLPEIA